MSASGIDASKRLPPQNTQFNHPYSSSVASSASSSSSSIFSVDAHSSQSSAPSSSKSLLHTAWESDNLGVVTVTDYHGTSIHAVSQDVGVATTRSLVSRARSSGDAVVPELRQHPRRTQPAAHADDQNGNVVARPPPALVRQCDRKDNFVECLVDTTTQMIEVIWPLSVIPCGRDTVLGGKNLIGLRTFIQEVLKRSKTSYSTLQVALYYMVLIKPYVSGVDFTMEQSEDTHAARAMQCGRRMFLAALILASKYLQDRNYSARAWSKISGLKVPEINTNEMAFVTAIGWKLHVPEPLFQRWTDVVLKFSPPSSSSSPTFGVDMSRAWRSIIPRLTPSLEEVDLFDKKHSTTPDTGVQAICSFPRPLSNKLPMSPPSYITRNSSPCLTSNEQTPTMPIFKPLAMEPAIRDAYDDRPRFPPILPKISLLATPQMTPRSTNSNTPAVGVGGFCLGRSSMSLAMKQIHNTCMVRTTLDVWPSTGFQNVPASSSRPFPTSSRRSSLAPSSSSRSSPESMVSDVSSRSSRSSSISSVASSTCALPQPSLAVQATRRCANMQLLGIKEDCQTRMVSPSENGTAWEGYTSSPVSYTLGPRESYIRDTMATSIPRSSLHQFSDQDAAEGLRDLALNRYQRTLPPLSVTSQQPLLPRKRERPSSISDSSLQQSVRGLLQPQCLDNITNCSNNTRTDNVILVDTKIADSFVLHSDFKLPKSSHDRTSSENSRKRTCYMEGYESGMGLGERAGLPTLATGPGMWTGIL